MSQNKSPFRIGIIGVGAHGLRYLRHARYDVPGMVPTAICRRDREAGEALAKQHGCVHHADPCNLIASPDVDGVIVCTSPASHFDLCRGVIAAGKPLLVEKPMTGTLAEARELVALDAAACAEASLRRRVPLMVAQTLRWNPVVLKARELWPRLGPVRLVRVAQRLEPTALAWQRDPAISVGGSVLLEGVHIIDLVRHLTGQEFVAIDSRHRKWRNPALEDLFLARGTLDDGTLVSLEVSKYGQSRAGLLEAVGEEAALEANYQFGGLRLVRGRNFETISADAATPTLPRVLAAWKQAAWDALLPQIPVTATDGLRALEVIDACYRSHREEREVAVGEPKRRP